MSKTRKEISKDWYAAHPDYQKQRYAANREKMLAWRREYRKKRKAEGKAPFPSETKDRTEQVKAYREANRDACRARQKKCYDRKKEHYHAVALAAGKRWRTQNPEKAKAVNDAWRKANPEAVRASFARKRAKRRSAPGNGWTAQDVDLQRKAQKGQCFYCKKPLGKKFHRDHVTPLALGGHHCRSNLVLACAKCNQAKSAKPPQDFGLLL